MPSANLGPKALEQKQCQHCFKSENPPSFHLQSCSGCNRHHYCNKECQVADWPRHKKLCKELQKVKALLKEERKRQLAGDPTAPLVDNQGIERRLREWLPIHRPILQWGLVQALTLQITPERCRTSLLTITVKPNFPTAVNANVPTSLPPARYFSIESTMIAPFDATREVFAAKDGFPSDTAFTEIVSRSEELRQSGGIGVGVIMIRVYEANLVHMMPVGMPYAAVTPQECSVNPHWETIVRRQVALGLGM